MRDLNRSIFCKVTKGQARQTSSGTGVSPVCLRKDIQQRRTGETPVPLLMRLPEMKGHFPQFIFRLRKFYCNFSGIPMTEE